MKKRSILISMLVIGVVAALIAAATTATFSDQVTSTSNSFKAGTLSLVATGATNTCDRSGNAAGLHGADATAVGGGNDAAGADGCDLGAITFQQVLTGGTTSQGGNLADPTCTNMAPGDQCKATLSILNGGSLTGKNLTMSANFGTLTLPTGCAASNWSVTYNNQSIDVGAGTPVVLNAGPIAPGAGAAAGDIVVTFKSTAGNPCQGVNATNALNLVFHIDQNS